MVGDVAAFDEWRPDSSPTTKRPNIDTSGHETTRWQTCSPA